MDEEETKNCPNCKREIPAVNFTIHSVHCARNIRMCPVCKEPVPSTELDDHHQKFHKLLPCKQCGESVCGTDLEDHIRDSCANTIKTCRYCELELPRREIPAHEAYCGVRTEQCAECREWVMIKYRQLHVDSNHGFLRLDDDPAPPKKEPPKLSRPPIRAFAPPAQPIPSSSARFNDVAGSSNGAPKVNNLPENSGTKPAIRPTTFEDAGPSGGGLRNNFPRQQANAGQQERPVNGVKKRTNDQPQININKEAASKVDKNLAISRGAVKKRPAPRPPLAPPPEARRDLPYYSAVQRQQREEREREEKNRYNLAHGLPPVLSPAAKIEKLRKMDALQNPDTEEEYRRHMKKQREEEEKRRQEFKNLKPMSPEQFMARFNEMQLRGDGDRIGEIKSSLRALRRGLNEVTAPYNVNNNSANNNNDRRRPSPGDVVRLPCEFCTELVPADDLVQHQTGCRPDLAQYRAESPRPRAARPPRARSAHLPRGEPVIPCEFCSLPLPVYLITAHQEECARDGV